VKIYVIASNQIAIGAGGCSRFKKVFVISKLIMPGLSDGSSSKGFFSRKSDLSQADRTLTVFWKKPTNINMLCWVWR